MNKDVVAEGSMEKGRLPACAINVQLLQRLWNELNQDGDVSCSVIVGTGGDLLGKVDKEERPYQKPASLEDLLTVMKSVPRIDSLSITAEVTGKGTIQIEFKNYTPPTATLKVTGSDNHWAKAKYEAIKTIFDNTRDNFVTLLYSWCGFGVVQTVIPLSLSFILVLLVADLAIPYNIRYSQWLGWLTALTLVVTLRFAYTISDRLIIYTLTKYPYIRWR